MVHHELARTNTAHPCYCCTFVCACRSSSLSPPPSEHASRLRRTRQTAAMHRAAAGTGWSSRIPAPTPTCTPTPTPIVTPLQTPSSTPVGTPSRRAAGLDGSQESAATTASSRRDTAGTTVPGGTAVAAGVGAAALRCGKLPPVPAFSAGFSACPAAVATAAAAVKGGADGRGKGESPGMFDGRAGPFAGQGGPFRGGEVGGGDKLSAAGCASTGRLGEGTGVVVQDDPGGRERGCARERAKQATPSVESEVGNIDFGYHRGFKLFGVSIMVHQQVVRIATGFESVCMVLGFVPGCGLTSCWTASKNDDTALLAFLERTYCAKGGYLCRCFIEQLLMIEL